MNTAALILVIAVAVVILLVEMRKRAKVEDQLQVERDAHLREVDYWRNRATIGEAGVKYSDGVIKDLTRQLEDCKNAAPGKEA